jgi:hypothetical protein
MSDHKSIDQLRAELGVITFGNQHLYSDHFSNQPTWSEREALEWIKIFANDDYDDYSALAWDIVLLVERQISTEGVSELTKIGNYWAQLTLQSLSPQIQSAETD